MTIGRAKAAAVRAFATTDGEALARLHIRAILATSDQFYAAAERESWASALTAQGYANSVASGEIIEVAADGERAPVAFCSRRGDEILGLYVDPDWQGVGIGGLLLDRAETAIAATGHRIIKIKSSLSAVSFYQTHGYAVTSKGTHATRGGLILGSANLEKLIVK